MLRTIAGVAAIVCLLPTAGHGQNGNLPAAMLSALHQVQDNFAYGDPIAAAAQTEILARLELELSKPVSDAEAVSDWEKTVIGFALSGGDAAASKDLLAKVDKQSRFFAVGQATELYASGDMGEAARRFAQIDPRSISGGLTPYVMLALGTASLDNDIETARRSFETVVLEAPGTLLEEVALRRLLALGLASGDETTFQRVSNLYLRRYFSSPFASQFIDSYVAGLIRFLTADELSQALKIVAGLPSTNRHTLISRLLTSCAIDGRLDMLRQITRGSSDSLMQQDESLKRKFNLYGLISNIKVLETPALLVAAKRDGFGSLDKSDSLMRDKAFHTLERMFDEIRGQGFEADSDKKMAVQDADRTVPSAPFGILMAQLIDNPDGEGARNTTSAMARAEFDGWFLARFANDLRELSQIEHDVGTIGE